MRRSAIGFAVLILVIFVLAGIRPDALPFVREQARFSDAVVSHWPNAFFLRQSILERGEFPIWRETIMAGQPFLANPLNKTAYPFQWLALLFPPALHLNLLVIFHAVLAGVGMYTWATGLGLRPESALLAGLAYVVSPRLFGHLAAGHLDIVYALAWWPWLMWAVLRTKKPAIGLSSGLLIGMLAALLVIADSRVGLFAVLSAVVYGVYLARQQRVLRLKVLTGGGAVLVASILLIGVIVPFALWSSSLNRAALTPSEAGAMALTPAQFLTLLFPAQHGNVETMVYLGLPVLLLAFVGLIMLPRHLRWLAVGIALLIILYGMGVQSFLWNTLVSAFPVLLWFRVPARIWLMATLFAPLLAAYGYERLLMLNGQHGVMTLAWLKRTAIVWIAVCAAFGVFALFVLPSPLSGILILSVGTTTGVLLFAAVSGWKLARHARSLFISLIVIDLASGGIYGLEWRGPEQWLDPYRPLAERLVALEPARIYSPTYSLEQQIAEAYGLRLFGGVDPFQLSGVAQGIEQGSGVPLQGYQVVLPPLLGSQSDLDIAQANRTAIIDTEALAQWSVSHVVAAYAIDHPRLLLADVVNNVYIYQNLDYEMETSGVRIPDWPLSASDLPDQATVQRWNQISMLGWLVSGIGWVVCPILLIVLWRRHAHD
ncbi:MAG: hypothetical protein JNM70_12585 [Anaerolineae bacterium]|nr:hypothetical protein [Anaerolineae bacterium]